MFKWIDEQKDKDNWLSDIMRLGYRFGKNKYFLPLLSAALGIFVPLCFQWGVIGLAILLLFLLIGSSVFHTLCCEYADRMYNQRKYAVETLDNQSSILNSFCIEVRSNNQWKNTIFRKISDIVCEKIRRLFKEQFNCETRVSVEYTFDKENNKTGKIEKHVKMSARRSPEREVVSSAVPLEDRSMYYSYDIFSNNLKGINVLFESDIENGDVWYRNESHFTEVKLYLGIAVSPKENNNVDFILQIDFIRVPEHLKNKGKKELEQFINQYLKSYINIICLTYLLNLNKHNQIPEA